MGITSSHVNMGNMKCIGNCEHVSEVYCNGEYGLPIFEQHTVTQGIYF